MHVLFRHSVVSTLCESLDCSLPGSSVYGILQVRILEYATRNFKEELRIPPCPPPFACPPPIPWALPCPSRCLKRRNLTAHAWVLSKQHWGWQSRACSRQACLPAVWRFQSGSSSLYLVFLQAKLLCLGELRLQLLQPPLHDDDLFILPLHVGRCLLPQPVQVQL